MAKYEIGFVASMVRVNDDGTKTKKSLMNLEWLDMEYEDCVEMEQQLPKLFEILAAMGQAKSEEKRNRGKGK